MMAFAFAHHAIPFAWLAPGTPFRKMLQCRLANKNLFPAQLAERIVALSVRTKEELYEHLRGKDVYLMVDGATVQRRCWMGFALSDGEHAYHLRNVEIKESCTTRFVHQLISDVVQELAHCDIRVFSVTADNASAMQGALKQLSQFGDLTLKELDSLTSETCSLEVIATDSDFDSDTDSEEASEDSSCLLKEALQSATSKVKCKKVKE